MQITTFPFEIIVHDDASTDGTAEIIREYADKYPDIIKPIYQQENRYSKGEIFGIYTDYIFPKARGKYLAFCEGDDYWIDPDKLQLQFDYMENHPQCALASHNVYTEDVVSGQRTLYYKQLTSGEYSAESILSATPSYPHTTSLFCRTETYRNTPEFYLQSPVPDTPMIFHCFTKGNTYYSNKVMSVWRFAHPTSWTYSMLHEARNNQLHCLKMLKFYELFDVYTQRQFHISLLSNMQRYQRGIIFLESFGVCEDLYAFYQWLKQNNDCADSIDAVKNHLKNMGFMPVWHHMKNAAANGKKLFLYGAGVYGTKAAGTMIQNGLPLEGFIVSDGQHKEKTFFDFPVYYRSELPYSLKDIGILIALKPEIAKEVWATFADHENIWYPFKRCMQD